MVSNNIMRLCQTKFSLLLAGVMLLSSVAMTVAAVCDLPSTYRWTSTGVLAKPKTGWISLKDFTHVGYNGQNLVYATAHDGRKSWASMSFGLFNNWTEASMGTASQNAM